MNARPKKAPIAVRTALVLVLMLGACLTAFPAQGESDLPVPEGRTYFTVILGSGSGVERFEPQVACIRFRRRQICVEGQCGVLFPVDDPAQTRKRRSFGFEIILQDTEHIHLLGLGRANDRGPGSSIGGALEAVTATSVSNLSFAGRAVSPARCRELVAQFAE
jgi:hypothetical protein